MGDIDWSYYVEDMLKFFRDDTRGLACKALKMLHEGEKRHRIMSVIVDILSMPIHNIKDKTTLQIIVDCYAFYGREIPNEIKEMIDSIYSDDSELIEDIFNDG